MHLLRVIFRIKPKGFQEPQINLKEPKGLLLKRVTLLKKMIAIKNPIAYSRIGEDCFNRYLIFQKTKYQSSNKIEASQKLKIGDQYSRKCIRLIKTIIPILKKWKLNRKKIKFPVSLQKSLSQTKSRKLVPFSKRMIKGSISQISNWSKI